MQARAIWFLGTMVWLLAGCAYWSEAKTSPGAKNAKSAPATTASEPEAPSPSGPVGETVRLRGSSTVGTDLAPKLAAAFLSANGAPDVTTRLGSKNQNRIVVSGTLRGRVVTFEIEYPGSDAAFECLRTGTCDVGMASRPIQTDEIEKLKELGDMTSPACEHVLAMDGIAVIVNRSNRLTKLSVAQIAGIFGGELKTWDRVGGSPKEVHVVTRDKVSGTYDTFVQFAMAGRDVTDRATVVDDSEAVAAQVAKDEAAIGFVGLPYVAGAKALAVQDGNATALVPTPFTVGTEDYAFSRRLFLYTAEKPKSALAAQFVDYALSDAGQGVVPQTGFVSLNVQLGTTAVPAEAPEGYAKATSGAQRLSFNFRFRGNTARLDPKSVKDLDRMARFIKVTSSNARSVTLLGFSDDQGSEQKNVEVSRQRASTIADQLRGRGIEAERVEGFGSALRLAPNEKDSGRAKNRRVEVWLR
jgi:phosphate transport system substrate-binding protein